MGLGLLCGRFLIESQMLIASFFSVLCLSFAVISLWKENSKERGERREQEKPWRTEKLWRANDKASGPSRAA